MKVGDFVHSYTKGIWQIYRIINYKTINLQNDKSEKKETVFLKRFISASYKKSFSEECCDPSFVSPLSVEELIKLNNFIENNKDLFEEFNNYMPKPIDAILNIKIRKIEQVELKQFTELLKSRKKMTYREINKYIVQNNLKAEKSYGNTLQFVSNNFEIKNGNLVYQYSRILDF